MPSHMEPSKCDDSGYIRHWVISDVKVTPYTGEMVSENQLRVDIVDPEIVDAPEEIALNAADSSDISWRYYDPGQNIFVERSSFYHQLSALDMHGVTYVESSDDLDLPVQFWACGDADLWVNGVHVCRQSVPRYMYPEATQINMPLKRGRNRLSARLQALGVRDTRFLFGVRVMNSADKLSIWLPGPEEFTYKLAEIEEWLESIRVSGRNALRSTIAAPIKSSVKLRGKRADWPEGENQVRFAPTGQSNLTLEIEFDGQELKRSFEIPANRIIASSEANSLEEHRRESLQHIADTGRDIKAVLARHALGERSDEDEVVVETMYWDRILERGPNAEFLSLNRESLGAYWDSLERLKHGFIGCAECRLFSIKDFVDTLFAAAIDDPDGWTEFE